jgi:hypothetical protein
LGLIKDATLEAEETKAKMVLNLIYLGDRLIELLYQIKTSGYDPSIKYEAGKLS